MNHMTKRGADCTLSEDKMSFSFQTSYEDGKCENHIRYLENEELLLVNSIIKVEDKLALINSPIEFLNKINREKMFIGFFIFWEEQKVIEYRSSINIVLAEDSYKATDFIVFHAFKSMRILKAECDEFISNTN